MPILKPIATRPASVTEMVQDAIREAIITRSLQPGDRVTEAGLARQLDVSKTPVREALLKLECAGLIESDGGRGGRVVQPSPGSIRSAFEVRTALETQAARLLAERGDRELVAASRKSATLCLEAAEHDDLGAFRDHDRRFHLGLAAATGNPLLERLIHDAFDLTWTLRNREVPMMDDSLLCARQHVLAIDAIEAGEADEAQTQMRAHIQTVLDLVITEFQAQSDR
ncbi:GntR family transcriptional regulator [Herbiconiux sp. P17]|uniref:GntR family transcriptional regulator n=1 Tax=Herbiconiux wuyangfengii TaxID=3342794 RepID=UPI0035B772F7